MEGGHGTFKNLCLTNNPRGFYFPSYGNWRPRILFRMSQTNVLPNEIDPGLIRYYPARWTGAQLGELTIDCDGSLRKPDLLNYEPAYYANSSSYCQANPKQRLCPNHWT